MTEGEELPDFFYHNRTFYAGLVRACYAGLGQKGGL